jgi:hypothetical protein
MEHLWTIFHVEEYDLNYFFFIFRKIYIDALNLCIYALGES